MLVKESYDASQNIQDDLFLPTSVTLHLYRDSALQFKDTNLVNMCDSFQPCKRGSTSSGNFLIATKLVAPACRRPSFNQNWLGDTSYDSSLDQSSAILVFL